MTVQFKAFGSTFTGHVLKSTEQTVTVRFTVNGQKRTTKLKHSEVTPV